MNAREIDAAALAFAARVSARQPRGDFLFGSPTGEASQVGDYYSQAGKQLVNSTGSPAAQTFGKEEAAALQPQFAQEDQGLAAQEAAMGITNSGAAKNDFQNLGGTQSATLAGAIAPLYQQALSQYGSILQGGAGAQAGAYQQGIQDVDSGIGSLFGAVGDAFGVPGIGGGSTSPTSPSYNPYGGVAVDPYGNVAGNYEP